MAKVLYIALKLALYQLLLIRVIKEWCIAEVLHMVRTAHFVQDQVPVQENVHTRIQISDNVMGILLCVRQMILCTVFAEFNARFGQHKFLPREAFPDHLERFKVIAAIPMECNAGNHVVCLCIDDDLRPFKGPFLVVVPDIDFNVIQAMRSE